MKTIALFMSLIAVTTLARPASSRTVYLNGVDISGVHNQTFKQATVKIDETGNIYITAPGYKVEVREAPPAPEKKPPPSISDRSGPNSALTNRYYLVTQPSPYGRAQYDFTISVNGVDKKTIPAGSPQQIVEISAWLHEGDNVIVVRGIKNLEGGRKSSSKSDSIRVLIGVGHEEGKTVKVDNVKASVKADASMLSTVKKRFVIKAL